MSKLQQRANEVPIEDNNENLCEVRNHVQNLLPAAAHTGCDKPREPMHEDEVQQ